MEEEKYICVLKEDISRLSHENKQISEEMQEESRQ